MSDDLSEIEAIELAEEPDDTSIIRVIGVGGGGSNAVNYIFNKDLEGIECIAINTDAKSLDTLAVTKKLAIAQNGAGANPLVSKKAAEDHADDIRYLLKGAEMVFITAGMGKGTGTGASPVVARIAREMGILTIGVVTIPFEFEGKTFIRRAIDGLDDLRENVDSLLIIANERIKTLYGSFKISKAFGLANDIIATAINGIAGAVTSTQGIRTDMEDMRTTLMSGQNIMMGVGMASGENRAILAIRNALDSKLLVNNDIKGGDRIILNYAMSHEYEMTIEEMEIINDELKNRVGYYGDQIWGTLFDDSLGDILKVTIVVTGINGITNEELENMSTSKRGFTSRIITTKPVHTVETAPTETPVAQTETSAEPASAATLVTPAASAAPAEQAVAPQTETLTIEKPQPRRISLADLESGSFLESLEADTPNWGQMVDNSHEPTFTIGNDKSDPIVHNDFLNNNVD